MKATFSDFLASNPNCSKYGLLSDANKIFDFLSSDEIIIKMIDSVENSKNALAGCVEELELFYYNLKSKQIDFSDGFTRTVIGRMIKTILAPFGYLPTAQKGFSKNCHVKYFSSASCYEKKAPASMRIVKRVEEIL